MSQHTVQQLIEPLIYHSGEPRKVLPGVTQKDLEKLVDQALQQQKSEIEKLKDFGKQLPYGIVRTQKMRMETVKCLNPELAIELAYEDGFTEAINRVLELLTQPKE